MQKFVEVEEAVRAMADRQRGEEGEAEERLI
jgi:hypothetical protein